MRRGVKRLVAAYMPGVLKSAQRLRRRSFRRHADKVAAVLAPHKAVFVERCGWKVQGGVLKGLECRHDSRSDTLFSRLVGCYEEEIHPGLEAALARNPTVLVDVGCEEGYFAVGLALRRPDAVMHAFDTSPAARGWCRDMARLNGVEDRVRIAGACDPRTLAAVLGPRSLVLSDCEGYEYELLDPAKVPGLAAADLVVELHEHKRADINPTPAFLARFAATHDIDVVEIRPRDPADYRCLRWLPPDAREAAVYENRTPSQRWVIMLAKERA